MWRHGLWVQVDKNCNFPSQESQLKTRNNAKSCVVRYKDTTSALPQFDNISYVFPFVAVMTEIFMLRRNQFGFTNRKTTESFTPSVVGVQISWGIQFHCKMLMCLERRKHWVFQQSNKLILTMEFCDNHIKSRDEHNISFA